MPKPIQKRTPQRPSDGAIKIHLSEQGTAVVMILGDNEGHFHPKVVRDIAATLIELAHKAEVNLADGRSLS